MYLYDNIPSYACTCLPLHIPRRKYTRVHTAFRPRRRAQVLAVRAHAHASLWVLNGDGVLNALFNYSRASFREGMLGADLSLLRTAMSVYGIGEEERLK